MIDDLSKLSRHFLKLKNNNYKRYLIENKDFKNNRLYIIIGQRGVGKTTTLIQLLLERANGNILNDEILYIQADHFKIGDKTLYEIAEAFSLLGGKYIAIDEIHKYSNWSKELKSIYDTFPDLSIFSSGSSALELSLGSNDLSRRAIKYTMLGMSIREFIEINYKIKLRSCTIEEIINDHEKISHNIIEELLKKDLKIIPLFLKYLKVGYYPYFQELNCDENLYKITLEQNVHTTIESDLASIFPKLTGNSLKKIKQLLIYISESVPFTPHWQKILKILEVGDDRTLKVYFKHLEEAKLIQKIQSASNKLNKIEKEEKIYLDNTNLLYAISTNANIDTIRETFFINMLLKDNKVHLFEDGDFLINSKYIFEIGGKNKNFKQLKKEKNSFVVSDNIEIGIKRKIPLWLFGFLY
ncbi:MAG: hypothetical protein A3F40_04145 [Chlamydiae bacterium RIFCSPHIGHO2_12_FULL_27_8]|nr:MAG: hypothetical protein A3F40_04145 [Chlamydiae bacterium RIFCSPHIGHO2_12_FULL_27_8]OGN66258.1 MAG: hypothetical protein A2888_01140 [Chlamydiae bacterium RIFCSPLOWO2_01_FULL_28_7]